LGAIYPFFSTAEGTQVPFTTLQGGGIAWTQYDLFNITLRVALVTFSPFLPLTADQVRQANQTLSPFQQQGLERAASWSTTANSYFLQQTNKVRVSPAHDDFTGLTHDPLHAAFDERSSAAREPHRPTCLDGREVHRMSVHGDNSSFR
jgi:hypothetical protein